MTGHRLPTQPQGAPTTQLPGVGDYRRRETRRSFSSGWWAALTRIMEQLIQTGTMTRMSNGDSHSRM